jgi:hypothetical protein
MVSELIEFNLDLSRVETLLKEQKMHVQSALVMPGLLKAPLQRDTVFVLQLQDDAAPSAETGGMDVQQYTTDRFAVVLGLRAAGDSTGVTASTNLAEARTKVKSTLIGAIFGVWEPVEFEGGKIIEVNRETQNILYQMQFKTAATIVTGVTRHD